MKIDLAILILTLCTAVFGSEVLYVHSSKPYVMLAQNTEKPFEMEDRICVTRRGRDIACGNVMLVKEKLAVAKLDYQLADATKYEGTTKSQKWVEVQFSRPTPEQGDPVRIVLKDPKRKIRQLTSELLASNTLNGETREDRQFLLEKIEESKPFEPVSFLGFGLNLASPHFHYQQSINNRFAVGLMPIYFNHGFSDGNASLKGPGFFCTLSRYYGGPLSGFFWQFATGAYKMTAIQDGRTANDLYRPAILATGGYRYFFKDKMSMGFSAGGQYIIGASNAGGTGLKFSGFIPAVTADVGLAF